MIGLSTLERPYICFNAKQHYWIAIGWSAVDPLNLQSFFDRYWILTDIMSEYVSPVKSNPEMEQRDGRENQIRCISSTIATPRRFQVKYCKTLYNHAPFYSRNCSVNAIAAI